MDPKTAGVQYGTADNPHQHTDDMTVAPSRGAGSAQHMVQVAPNLDDLPEKRRIEYWAVLQSPNGRADIGEVSVKVYLPDSSLKHELRLQPVDCARLGDRSSAGTPLEAAFETGQVTAGEVNAILAGCSSNTKAVYRGIGDLSKEEPPGEYRAEVRATDRSGASNSRDGRFDVLPLVGLKIDFDRVDFGDVLANTPKRVAGDLIFKPSHDTRPTVKNVGNTPLHLNLKFGSMVGVITGKIINHFEAELIVENRSSHGSGRAYAASTGEGTVPGAVTTERTGAVDAGATATFKGVLGVRALGQLDLFVNPGAIAADTYRGTLTVWGSK